MSDYPKLLTRTGDKITLTSLVGNNQLQSQYFENRRLAFQRGDKHALFDTITMCAQLDVPLPPWAKDAVLNFRELWRTGQVETWDDLWGNPFPGKRRSPARRRDATLRVWPEVRRLHEQGYSIADAFVQAGKNLGIGTSTVSRAYYAVKRLQARVHRQSQP
jgi:hypothetical protein